MYLTNYAAYTDIKSDRTKNKIHILPRLQWPLNLDANHPFYVVDILIEIKRCNRLLNELNALLFHNPQIVVFMVAFYYIAAKFYSIKFAYVFPKIDM